MIKELNATAVHKNNLPVKILQFGEGNFLRAFVDWMIDKADEAGVIHSGLTVVQPIEGGERIENIFRKQDCLYHVYLEGIKDKKPVKEIRLVKSIMDIVNPYREYKKYEALFLSENLEFIISNTTEAGIRYEEGDDLNAEPPKSFPAKMTALLYKRYKKYKGDPSKGLIVICCELIEDNGSTLKKYVLQHAKHNRLEEGFTEWIDRSCHFYDTLVDRIVPGFPKENIDEVKAELGFDDNLVVKGEYFHIWAIGGDEVIKEKLPLDKAGLNVLFMDDIRPFRAKKVRILNGSHTALVPISLQLGCETVKEAMEVPEVEHYVNKMLEEEVLPVIKEDRNELKSFASKIVERFYNPYLKHHLKDISLNALSKWETRDYPTVYDNYKEKNKKADLALFSFAALLVLYSGKSEAKNFSPSDTPEFVDFIQKTYDKNDIERWVEGIVKNKKIWKSDFSEIPFFVSEVTKDIRSVLTNGMLEAVKKISANE